ncbi:MAG: cobalamin-binding protein [Pseudomonadota bacterium]|nr:cobalamin-binding protein [Pseudomonadota bacterium]
MAYALELGENLVGVTHECDFPAEARSKPAVVRNALPIETMTQREIDSAVADRLRQGLSLYELDAALIEELSPDLIITQSLCDVCAPSGNEIAKLLERLSKKPEILWMTPRNLSEIAENVDSLGAATGRQAEARTLLEQWRSRLEVVQERSALAAYRPRVFCMEWLDPVYCSGHWVPEMVRLAGGIDGLGREGGDSVRITWDQVLDWAPEVLVFMPCGYALQAATEQAAGLAALPGFGTVPAVRGGKVYAVDASAYFARPGPRVVEGTELLAHLIHPGLFQWDRSFEGSRLINLHPVKGMGSGSDVIASAHLH